MPVDYSFDVENVFRLATIHNVMPFIYKAAKNTANDMEKYKRNVIAAVGIQSRKNILFRRLYGEMANESFDPIIVKGPVCAATYPDFDFRLSSDFDIIIKPEIKDKVHTFLIKKGYKCSGEAYHAEAGLYLEVHTALFEGEGYIHRNAEKIFSDVCKNTVRSDIFKTLSYTDNLIYLIYHALKHFTVSGFGVRQIIDIALYAEAFKEDIDFSVVFKNLKKINGNIFALNIFNVAEKYLGFDFSYILKSVSQKDLFLEEFIRDLLDAGVFGKSGEDRLHSGGIVKGAVENSGKKSIIKFLFPKYSYMKNNHKILKYLPVLLPFFWVERIIKYLFKVIFGDSKVSPENSIKIADERLDLIRKMQII